MNRLIVLVVLLTGLGGFALGWFAFSSQEQPAQPGQAAQAHQAPPGPIVHRFRLSPTDMKLDRETPSVAVDDQGRVLAAWASQASETERTLWLARSEDGGKTFAGPVAFRKVPVHRYVSRMKGKEVTRSSSVAPRWRPGESRYSWPGRKPWTEALGWSISRPGPAMAAPPSRPLSWFTEIPPIDPDSLPWRSAPMVSWPVPGSIIGARLSIPSAVCRCLAGTGSWPSVWSMPAQPARGFVPAVTSASFGPMMGPPSWPSATTIAITATSA